MSGYRLVDYDLNRDLLGGRSLVIPVAGSLDGYRHLVCALLKALLYLDIAGFLIDRDILIICVPADPQINTFPRVYIDYRPKIPVHDIIYVKKKSLFGIVALFNCFGEKGQMRGTIISTEIVAAIYLLMILAAILHQYRRNQNKRESTFIWFVTMVAAGLICDATSYLLEGSTVVAALIFFNTAAYTIMNFCTIFFALYVTATIREKYFISRTATAVAIALSLLDIVCVLTGVVTGKLFYIENGYTVYGPWSDYIGVIPLISLIAFFCISFKGIRKLGFRQVFFLSTYLIFSFLNTGILYFFPDTDFSYVTTSFSCIIIFIFIQIDVVAEAWVSEQVLVSANKAKSDFLARMSHEIRTPVNTILGMDEMILRESRDNTVLEYAGDIRSAGRNLLSIINDILDLSKIESGKMEIIPVEYDLSRLLKDLTNMVTIRAK